MSIIKEIFPQCDICHDTNPDFIGYDKIKELRKQMRIDGWIRRFGKDICPDCVTRLL